MDLQTSHLAAALMSGAAYNNSNPESAAPSNAPEETKPENPSEAQKEPSDEDKEEVASGEEFSDEVPK